MEENIVMTPVTLPELTIEVVIIVVWLRPMDVSEISAEEVCQNHHTGKWGQCRDTLTSNDIGQTEGALRLALYERFLRSREVCHDLVLSAIVLSSTRGAG